MTGGDFPVLHSVAFSRRAVFGVIQGLEISDRIFTKGRTMARSKQKQKTGQTLQDFILVLSTLSNLYEEREDAGRAKSFQVASENLNKFAELTGKTNAVLKSSKDFKDVNFRPKPLDQITMARV